MTDQNTNQVSLSSLDQNMLYTVEELAPLFKVSQRTLRRYCSQGIFQSAVKIGGKQWLILGKDILSLFPACQ